MKRSHLLLTVMLLILFINLFSQDIPIKIKVECADQDLKNKVQSNLQNELLTKAKVKIVTVNPKYVLIANIVAVTDDDVISQLAVFVVLTKAIDGSPERFEYLTSLLKSSTLDDVKAKCSEVADKIDVDYLIKERQ